VVGNRLTQTRTITNTQVITSVYDNANRLTSVGGQAYTWDANGNLLNDGASQYVYDQANRVRVMHDFIGTVSLSRRRAMSLVKATMNKAPLSSSQLL
jgi:uncharacterized protein RhaS with RHS repeats